MMTKTSGTRRRRQEPIKADQHGLETALKHYRIEARYNLRAARRELRAADPINAAHIQPETWTPINDRNEAAVIEAIRRDFFKPEGQPVVFGRVLWERALNALVAGHEVDPFADWLRSLGRSSKSTGNGAALENYLAEKIEPALLGSWLSELFDIAPESRPFVHWASRWFFLAAVWRTFEPGYLLRQFPVLVGSQGIGKSALGRAILPSTFREEGHGDGLMLADDAQRTAEALQGKIIVEASEMAGMGRADIERLKANMTRTNDGAVRLAFRRNPESLPRRAIFYGTTNDRSCLPNDDSGNSRFVVIELLGDQAKERVEDFMDKHREELWRAAVAAHDKKEPPALPRDLAPHQAEANENYRRADIVIENAIAKLPEDQSMTLEEITRLIARDEAQAEKHLYRDGWSNRLGKALRSAGWQMKRVRIEGQQQRVWSKV